MERLGISNVRDTPRTRRDAPISPPNLVLEADGDILLWDLEAQVVDEVGELLVGLDAGQRDVDNVAAGGVGESLDQRRLAGAGWAVQQQPELVWKARNRVFS